MSESTSSAEELTRLTGEIVRKLFESSDGRYAVLRIREKNENEFIARGPLGGLAAGQQLTMSGSWERHPEFGRQFKVERFQVTLPGTTEGLKRFLGSGAIPGIGPKFAEQIVGHFGEDTLKALSAGAEKLREVPGIGKKKAAAIAECWQNASDRRESFIFLQGLGISPAYCTKLFKRYGSQAPLMVKNNPYRLAEEVDGIGFLKADEIARSLGIAENAPVRMTAAAVYALNELVGNGNVCVPLPALVQQISELTGQSGELAAAGVTGAMERHLLLAQNEMIYTPRLARAENELPQLIAELATVKNFAGQKLQPDLGLGKINFNEEQRFAVDQLQKVPLSIITGGPGVGKTTVVGEIVRRAKKAKLQICLAAPTGRAAKRLSESTGLTAKTLHRLLMFDPAVNRFTRDRDNPLECDLLIVDEISMLDILLAQALFRAVRPGTSVVLVGDADQLPSVGPGTVLASFLESGWFSVTRLTKIFRQAESSRIITNAHRVNRGQLPENGAAGEELSDFYWIEQDDPELALAIIEKLVSERIPARFGFNPREEVQILTPMNRGSCGTIALNEELQKLLNPGEKPQFKIGERLYKKGDKVMQTVNNYDKGVFNGDLGILESVNVPDRSFTVLFDGGREVEYSFDDSDQLRCAYAITVHKSQGCEFPVVILPFLSQHYMMLQRNLLYTAMTRAKKLLIIIGGCKALRMAVENARIEPRFSLLTGRLCELRKKMLTQGGLK